MYLTLSVLSTSHNLFKFCNQLNWELHFSCVPKHENIWKQRAKFLINNSRVRSWSLRPGRNFGTPKDRGPPKPGAQCVTQHSRVKRNVDGCDCNESNGPPSYNQPAVLTTTFPSVSMQSTKSFSWLSSRCFVYRRKNTGWQQFCISIRWWVWCNFRQPRSPCSSMRI